MTAGDTTAEVAEQQALLVALAATLNGVPVHYWLMGGWAVDAHLGRITRRHSDIDFAVLLIDRDAVTEAHGRMAWWSCRVPRRPATSSMAGRAGSRSRT